MFHKRPNQVIIFFGVMSTLAKILTKKKSFISLNNCNSQLEKQQSNLRFRIMDWSGWKIFWLQIGGNPLCRVSSKTKTLKVLFSSFIFYLLSFLYLLYLSFIFSLSFIFYLLSFIFLYPRPKVLRFIFFSFIFIFYPLYLSFFIFASKYSKYEIHIYEIFTLKYF